MVQPQVDLEGQLINSQIKQAVLNFQPKFDNLKIVSIRADQTNEIS